MSGHDRFEHDLSAGDFVDGKYRVVRVLGSGGMAVVWAAYHVRLDEWVAIKVLRRECAQSPELLARFRREARAAVKIKGEHAARVLDVGALPNGLPYMVMEHLEGSDLANWLRASGKLPVAQAAEFVLQTAEALAEAHALGIVHRDLKPANLFVTHRPDGSLSVKVLDFGISKVAPALGTSDITQRAALVGTPLYMAPEQLREGKGLDARADLWALGVILYELLTGEPPFTADSMPEVVHRIATSAPIPPRVLRGQIPAGLEAVVLKCIEKDRDLRYPDVAAFARALAPFAGPHARAASERVGQILAVAKRSKRQRSPIPQAVTRPTLRFWPDATTVSGKRALRVGMVASALLGGVALWSVQLNHAPPPPAAEPSSEPPPKLPVQLQAPVEAAQPAPSAPSLPDPAPVAEEATLAPTISAPLAPSNRSSARSRERSPRTSTRAPSPTPTAVPTTAEEPRDLAPLQDRDASVRSMGDDLRPLRETPRPRRQLDDPYR